jgi:hypothetical protein
VPLGSSYGFDCSVIGPSNRDGSVMHNLVTTTSTEPSHPTTSPGLHRHELVQMLTMIQSGHAFAEPVTAKDCGFGSLPFLTKCMNNTPLVKTGDAPFVDRPHDGGDRDDAPAAPFMRRSRGKMSTAPNNQHHFWQVTRLRLQLHPARPYAKNTSIWLIAPEAPSITPISRTCCNASAVA